MVLKPDFPMILTTNLPLHILKYLKQNEDNCSIYYNKNI